MHRFKEILFIADGGRGERSGLARAIDLAESNGARLTLMDVLEVEKSHSADPKLISSVELLQDSLLADRRDELKRVVGTIAEEHPSVPITVEVRVGPPATEVIRAVMLRKYDLVMKAINGNMGKLKMVFGSTDLTLMRKCPCPVWIVQGSSRKRDRRVLAAVDMNPNKPEAESLARLIMPLATSIANQEKSELHVVKVWRVLAEAKLRGRSISARTVDTLIKEIKQAHLKGLVTLLSDYPYSERTVHLLEGHPGKVIPDLVKMLEIDLVVIGTVGRSGIPGLIIGNTAEKILGAVDCSVLTIKREGLLTPIEAKGGGQYSSSGDRPEVSERVRSGNSGPAGIRAISGR